VKNLNSNKIMKRLSSFKPKLRVGAVLAVVISVCYAASLAGGTGGDTNAPDVKAAEHKPTEAKPADTKPAKKVAPKKLTGGDLYAINCSRCHPERYATEFTSTQWKTLMMHMRVRANLPAAQAKLILKYLQEDSGN
jgi:hypothetical protein